MPAATDATGALALLLSEWTDNTFSIDGRDIAALNHLWLTLAGVLCNFDSARVKAFKQEIANLRSSKRAGSPPISALRERLHEIVEEGISELFLVIAIRQAMEQLISVEFSDPHITEEWKKLADAILPLKVQFAYPSNEAYTGQITLSPEE